MLGSLRVPSSGWWGLVLCASLAVGAHIVFDILDVDGSDLRNRTFNDPLVAQTSLVETKRPLHLASECRHGWGRMPVAVLLRQSSARFSPQYKSVPAAARVRLHRILPRAHVRLNARLAPSTTDDQARTLAHTR